MNQAEDFWSEIVGQDAAVRTLEHVSSDEGAGDLAHAWLITGPPGSGRSNLAYRFAAALIARDHSEREQIFQQVRAHTHPDLDVLTTEGSIIKIDHAREIALRAHYSPTTGRYRVIIAEDADRLPERSSNTLLMSLEEPPERTVWILCTPSEADVLPTIRSRSRSLRLVTPSLDDVARLLHQRDGIAEADAKRAARLAQSHIGMARKLATDPESLERRNQTVKIALQIETIGDAMSAAAQLLKVAEADAKALTEQRDATERDEAFRNLGVAPGGAIPPRLRAQIKALEEDQKRRRTRSLRDGIDRVFTDLLSLYRDALMLSLNAGVDLVNLEVENELRQWVQRLSPEQIIELTAAIDTARERLARNVGPALTLEALFSTVIICMQGQETR